MRRALLIENTPNHSIRGILEEGGYRTELAASIHDALESVAFESCDLILVQAKLGLQSGTDIIPLAQGVPVVVLDQYENIRTAIDAIKLGACDYIAEPFHRESTLELLEQARSTRKKPGFSSRTRHAEISDAMFGRCHAMRRVFQIIEKVAPTQSTMLIQGETGTGKELAARAVHQISSRRDKPLISVNCAAIPETLIESELFGHEKGSFTGAVSARNGLIEAADGGTLFLDEIGELPFEAQARLLRVLQEGEIRKVGSTQTKAVDVRLIAATHRNLLDLSRQGQFREDLYYRLNVIQVTLPPLRERGNDIKGLSETLLTRISEKLGTLGIRFSENAQNTIERYQWPGNIRELENAIERAAILCENKVIEPVDLALPFEGRVPTGIQSNSANEEDSDNKLLSMEDYFQQFVLENEGAMSETELAQKLGISRKNLWQKRQKFGIPRKR